MLMNCGVGEDSWECLGLQGDPTWYPKGNHSWIFIGRTDAEAESPILRPPDAKSWLTGKDPNAGKDWRLEKKGDNRQWDGWMASLTWWTWVWIISGSWWWTGKPGMLQSMGSQSQTWLSDRTELRIYQLISFKSWDSKKYHYNQQGIWYMSQE